MTKSFRFLGLTAFLAAAHVAACGSNPPPPSTQSAGGAPTAGAGTPATPSTGEPTRAGDCTSHGGRCAPVNECGHHASGDPYMSNDHCEGPPSTVCCVPTCNNPDGLESCCDLPSRYFPTCVDGKATCSVGPTGVPHRNVTPCAFAKAPAAGQPAAK